jgi:endonuclease/exonuclease/phosphatase family metal-dependent hydrolase
MQIRCLLLAAASAITFAFPNEELAERQGSDAAGSLALDPSGEDFNFNYSTTEPSSTNWIGLYRASGGGPVNGEYVAPSLVWTYAPETSGSVTLDASDVDAGDYRAFFLAQDGYRWLADPLNLTRRAPPADIYFPVESAILHNARQREPYTARVSGLILGRGDSTVTFKKLSGDRWINVNSDGTISGTPGPARAGDASTVRILATASENNSTATITLMIPVHRHHERLTPELSVMAYNLWAGGTRVNNYHEKQLRFILNSGADIIALQESGPNHATRLGDALGWYSHQSAGSFGIISRYPIAQEYGQISNSAGVRVDLSGGSKKHKDEVNVWSVHLSAYPYGPYGFCYENMTKDEVTALEVAAGRTPQVELILTGIASQLSNSRKTPVFVAGDFNAPSHLDWVPALQEKNCGIDEINWQASVLPQERGLVDSYRVVHPDPAVEQGITWSPVYPQNEGSTGPDEPQDRIDFVYHTEYRLRVLSSEKLVIGDPRPVPDQADNEWTSDHAAVLTRYRFK